MTLEHGKTKELKLGYWCDNQRRNKAQLSQERKKKLEKIGFRFGGKKRRCREEEGAVCITLLMHTSIPHTHCRSCFHNEHGMEWTTIFVSKYNNNNFLKRRCFYYYYI